jgi:CheY-like chemotaxis protein
MAVSGANRRVLVVDDECIIADTLALILERNGFVAKAVYSGEKAIEAARELKPHALISDVVMNGMTGIDAAIDISKIVPDCRIILFSGQAATADLQKRAKASGHSFEILAKPVHPTVILNLLANKG